MPINRPAHTERPLAVGDYLVNRRSAALVEIMRVDLSGNVMVLDVTAALDGEWQLVSASQITSSVWVRASDHEAAT